MSEILKDFRGKITAETWCFIEAEHQATGEDHSAIVREILHGWALKKLAEMRLADHVLSGQGIQWKAGDGRK